MNWTRAKNVVWEELGCGSLLVNPATGARWTLNATATALWKLCDGRYGSAELATMLDRSSAEIARFCEQFKQIGLLQPALVPVYAHASLDTIIVAKLASAPTFKPLGLGNGPRRRPTARGVSGPA